MASVDYTKVEQSISHLSRCTTKLLSRWCYGSNDLLGRSKTVPYSIWRCKISGEGKSFDGGSRILYFSGP
jgi:hypothetical protein